MQNQDKPATPNVSEAQRLPGRLPKSTGFVRLSDAGALEIELYDRSDRAHNLFDSDVATIYTVQPSQWPLLVAGLQWRQEDHTLYPSASAVDWSTWAPSELPTKVANSFLDIDELLQWLIASEVQFSTVVDSWA